ncbi:unnamed protein product [Rhizoctonia solani]|uniref:Uncharacterized protein n=1 Tax=Rhizoctonia solani TaxID=456999 RepID=A0A8H3GKV4_9AGAM|nr:unnamed protein product [Rhizoctonia solani]
MWNLGLILHFALSSMSNFPYQPFPFNVTPASPLFGLSPVALNTDQGWIPSCSTPECVPTASWSTGLIGSTLSFQFWGWDVAFDGIVKGNMSVEVLRDGVEESWNPLADTLFRLYGQGTDQFYLHNITLKVLDASPNAELTVNQARVNGSTLVDVDSYPQRWIIPSNDMSLSYTGFIEQASAAETGSRALYISSKAGDTASMQFNASTFLLYGPCGPKNGLIKITVDGRESTVNTSMPIQSNDCLLFQAKGLSRLMMHQLIVENIDGATLGIDRFEFFWLADALPGRLTAGATTVVFVFVSVFTTISFWAGVMIFLRRPNQGKKLVRMFKVLFS